MAARSERNLTEGPIAGHVAALAWPAVLSTLVHNLYGLNDTFFSQFAGEGAAGRAAQTAVTNSLFVLIAVFGLVQLASIGTLAITGRRSGAGDHEGAGRAARQGLLFAAALSIGFAAAGVLLAPLLPRLMNMAPDVARETETYLVIVFAGSPAMFLFPVAESIFRARGDARTPLQLQVLAVSLNIAGNALAVFVLDAGTAGLAAATVFSRAVGATIAILLLARGRTGLSLARGAGPRFRFALWGRIARISAPLAAKTALFGLVYQVVTGIAADYGAAVQNGLGLGIRLEGLCFFFLMGFGLAAGPIVAQNLGADRVDRARRGAWITVAMGMVPATFFTLVFGFLAEPLAGAFTGDPLSARHAADYLNAVAIAMIFSNLEVVLSQAFVGAGDTFPPMAVDVPTTLLRIPLAWWLADGLGLGPAGIWWTISGTAVVRGALLAVWFRFGRWHRARPDLAGAV